MYFYWVKTTSLIKRFFSNYIWDIPNSKKTVYLTFDDGPTPDISYWILDQLREHEIKATFFCVGENLKRHPEVAERILQEGHIIANHTFTHPNGWTTNTEKYIEDALLCEEEIRKQVAVFSSRSETENRSLTTKLFRPPYGKLSPSQSTILRKMGYKIIMWDVLAADFLEEVSKEECLDNVINNATSGSIIIFHDNPKAFRDLEYTLPKAIEFLKEKGYKFDKIQMN
jgi:peptidoglycan/xylan/chitin deacetylase (PgdA/CDA1 family)